MKRHSTKLAVYLLSLFLACGSAVATDVEFYSLSSTVTDSSKIQMTEDLFFTQLLSLHQYKIVDKRPTGYLGTPANASQDTMVFYGELQENGSRWTCTLHLEQPHLNKKAQVTGTYDSYSSFFLKRSHPSASCLQTSKPLPLHTNKKILPVPPPLTAFPARGLVKLPSTR